MGEQMQPWEQSFISFRLFGNLYFIGNDGSSIHLVDTGEGLMMFDCGYRQSMDFLLEHIRALGFDPKDVKYLFLTHGHIDHFGAAKAMREKLGVKIALGEADRDYANGTRDLSYAKELGMRFQEFFEPDILLKDQD